MRDVRLTASPSSPRPSDIDHTSEFVVALPRILDRRFPDAGEHVKPLPLEAYIKISPVPSLVPEPAPSTQFSFRISSALHSKSNVRGAVLSPCRRKPQEPDIGPNIVSAGLFEQAYVKSEEVRPSRLPHFLDWARFFGLARSARTGKRVLGEDTVL